MEKTDYFLRDWVCFEVVLVIILLAGTCIADNNIIGTWQGLDEEGGAIDVVLYNNSAIEDTREECLG